MLKSYLIDNYGFNEPIFLNELCVEGVSDNAIRQAVKRLAASGFLRRYDNGIYYIPQGGKLLESGYIDPYLVIMRKFVRNKTDIYGYITGISFANQLGLTTQMPAVVEIITNKESTNGRMSMVGNQRVRIKKPAMKVTSQNADLLQLLDGIGQAEKYTELSEEETAEVLKNYIRKKNFTKNQLSEVSSVLTGTIAKKLIEWRAIYEFAS